MARKLNEIDLSKLKGVKVEVGELDEEKSAATVGDLWFVYNYGKIQLWEFNTNGEFQNTDNATYGYAESVTDILQHRGGLYSLIVYVNRESKVESPDIKDIPFWYIGNRAVTGDRDFNGEVKVKSYRLYQILVNVDEMCELFTELAEKYPEFLKAIEEVRFFEHVYDAATERVIEAVNKEKESNNPNLYSSN